MDSENGEIMYSTGAIHHGPSFIKFYVYLDPINRPASKSVQDQQSVASETDNI